jgi:predicted lysophospholipase L1 biosynthesis ABC-type transport system permease subunit
MEDRLPLFPAPYERTELGAMPVELVAVGTDGSSARTDRIRTAIVTAVPGTQPFLGAEARAESDRQIVQLNRLVNLALTMTLAIAGCGLAVSVAAGILERKRPFALLRLAGMQLRELQRTALLEATAPLLLIAGATAVLGLGTAAVVVTMAGGITWAPPTIGYWACLAAGLTVAVGLTAATLPLLARTTAPSAVRFE